MLFIFKDGTSDNLGIFSTECLSTTNWINGVNGSLNAYNGFKCSSDYKTFYFYSSSSYTNSNQLDISNQLYVFYGLTGQFHGELPYIYIETSGDFVVPYTRKYYIELYGRGGGGYHENNSSSYAAGGSSCQSYNNVILTKGEQIPVTIGKGRNVGYWYAATAGTGTVFGNYSVNGGQPRKLGVGGAGAGNLGTSGKAGDSASTNYSNGILAPLRYGFGMAGTSNNLSGNGGVVLKYLRT